ncbi:MAG: TIGR02757 family protein [Myxococcales bacterium]|nr:TIGR02757 family protein [Myxococcales bacterium]MBL0193740.1 TIGR02757 family protein [Myxococcales bacterium]
MREVLDRVRSDCPLGERRARDPVEHVHAFSTRDERELVGLLASALAFGNVATIRAKIAEVLERLDHEPVQRAEARAELDRRLRGFVHRLFRGEDVAGLLFGARACQRRFGSLEAVFKEGLARAEAAGGPRDAATWEALAFLVDEVRREGGLDRPTTRRGPAHLLPDVRRGGGAKRLFLFLRWMIRPADGVDLGVWSLPPSHLACPVDTHILKLGRNLGLTARADAGRRTVREITASLAALDPVDPVKYDFSLCHLGMATRCRERFDPAVCGGCPVRPACRHATRRARPPQIVPR